LIKYSRMRRREKVFLPYPEDHHQKI